MRFRLGCKREKDRDLSALVLISSAEYRAFYVVINSSETKLEKLSGFNKMDV